MKKVLVINSSARGLSSRSRKLTEVFVEHWRAIHINPLISFCELGNTAVPHVNERWIAAAFTPGDARSEEDLKALKISDGYISELKAADVILIAAPMYNWSVPSALKAYIDQVLRVNETFEIDRANVQHPYVGLLENKTLFLLLSRGDDGYEKGGYNEHMDYQTPYLRMIFNIMGISNIHVVAISSGSSDAIESSHQVLRMLIERELVLTKTYR